MKWQPGWIAVAVVLSGCDCGGGKRDSAAKWLDLEIEPSETETLKLVEEKQSEAGEDGLLRNVYPVPPSFLTSAPRGDDGTGFPEPFAAPSANERGIIFTRRETAQWVLEAHGVDFGPGAKAHHNPGTSALHVTQTPDQMDLVEAVISSCIHRGVFGGISIHFEIFELAADEALSLERNAAGRFEHSVEHEMILEMVRENSARIVTSARVLSRSGQRSAYEDAEAIRYVSGFRKPARDETGPPLPVFDVMKVGTVVETDPVLGPDNLTVDVNVKMDHHLAPPIWPAGVVGRPGEAGSTPRFHIGSFNTTETILSGQVKLLCSWAMPSDGLRNGLRHLVFMSVTAVRQ